ncbi:unnamed protein product [Clonostachys rosea]|uniref:Uncharacterized protein n=1 Tax=Bionectria ochroleuca TaxID=29856 RepID=A0ABY6TYK0_BIOOC|nr:unnamed protein product [Clonostachys rosea]
MAAHRNQMLTPGQVKALDEAIRVASEMHGPFKDDEAIVQFLRPLLEDQHKALRQELHMRHAYNIHKAAIKESMPPTGLPKADYDRQPTTTDPAQPEDLPIILDRSKRHLITIKPPGSKGGHGMCALRCQNTSNFISVEAMRKRRLHVQAGMAYKCVWTCSELDDVTRVGTFKAVSQLGADVAFGVNWLGDYPAPGTVIRMGTSLATCKYSPRGKVKPQRQQVYPETLASTDNDEDLEPALTFIELFAVSMKLMQGFMEQRSSSPGESASRQGPIDRRECLEVLRTIRELLVPSLKGLLDHNKPGTAMSRQAQLLNPSCDSPPPTPQTKRPASDPLPGHQAKRIRELS